MSTAMRLEQLFRQWHELTAGEAEAIHAEAWDVLADVQQRKADLQTDIVTADPDGQWQRAQLRPLLGALVEMERQNLDELQKRMARLQEQIAGLDANRRTLHRIKGAYVTRELRPAGSFGTA